MQITNAYLIAWREEWGVYLRLFEYSLLHLPTNHSTHVLLDITDKKSSGNSSVQACHNEFIFDPSTYSMYYSTNNANIVTNLSVQLCWSTNPYTNTRRCMGSRYCSLIIIIQYTFQESNFRYFNKLFSWCN